MRIYSNYEYLETLVPKKLMIMFQRLQIDTKLYSAI